MTKELVEVVQAEVTQADRDAAAKPVAWMYTYVQQHVSHYSAAPPSPLVSLTIDRWSQHKNWIETPLYAAPADTLEQGKIRHG